MMFEQNVGRTVVREDLGARSDRDILPGLCRALEQFIQRLIRKTAGIEARASDTSDPLLRADAEHLLRGAQRDAGIASTPPESDYESHGLSRA